MAKRSILITGAASGIGRDAAETLAREGWQVFAACRQAKDAANPPAGTTGVHLDYRDSATIQSALDQVLAATGGTLDALFNNGAIAIPAPLEDLPRGAMEDIFQVNFLGWHDLTQRVIPIMRRQGHGRIVNCSSVLGYVSPPLRGAYNATKFALEAWSDALRLEMDGTGIKVVLICPGPIKTNFRQNAIPHFEKWVDWETSARADEYRETLLNQLRQGSTGNPHQLPPRAVTDTLKLALGAPAPKARYMVTKPAIWAWYARRLLPTPLLDRVLKRF